MFPFTTIDTLKSSLDHVCTRHPHIHPLTKKLWFLVTHYPFFSHFLMSLNESPGLWRFSNEDSCRLNYEQSGSQTGDSSNRTRINPKISQWCGPIGHCREKGCNVDVSDSLHISPQPPCSLSSCSHPSFLQLTTLCERWQYEVCVSAAVLI